MPNTTFAFAKSIALTQYMKPFRSDSQLQTWAWDKISTKKTTKRATEQIYSTVGLPVPRQTKELDTIYYANMSELDATTFTVNKFSLATMFSHELIEDNLHLLIVAAMGVLYLRMPTAYLPEEDQGILFAQVILPTGSTLEQTDKVTKQIERYFQDNEKEAVASVMTLSGIGFSGRGQNNGMVFIKLKDWELRDRDDLKAKAIAGRAMAALSRMRNAMVFAFPPPAVSELGMAKGFDFQLLDRGGLGHQALMAAQYQLLGMAAKDQRLTDVRPNSMADVPEYRVDVTGKSPALWRSPSPPSTGRSRRPSAVPMSTTSFRAVGSSACTPRPTPSTACCPGTLASVNRIPVCRSTCGRKPSRRFALVML